MDKVTATYLIDLDNRFYRSQFASFSDTRQTPWEGWKRCAAALGIGGGVTTNLPYELLDLGCGNLRFERFLQDEFPNIPISCHGVDNCEPLVEQGQNELQSVKFVFQQLDLLAALLEDPGRSEIPKCACDGAIAFGILHHVPGFQLRLALLRLMLSSLKPGGVMAVSFWHFTEDATLKRKAEASTERALQQLGNLQLDEGDYLLGWKDEQNLFRYAHDFNNQDIDELTDALSTEAQVIDAFSADGRNGKLNSYRILRKRTGIEAIPADGV